MSSSIQPISAERNLQLEQSLSDGLLASGFAHDFVCLRDVESTMNAARDYSAHSEGEFTVMAETQLGGRGRQGRRWESPRGGYYGTTCLRASRADLPLAGFSLAVGVAVKRSFSEHYSLTPKLKWPNDIFTPDGKKLGGVLIEVLSERNSRTLLAGVGVNLLRNDSTPDEGLSVEEFSGKKSSAQSFASIFLPQLLSVWRDFQQRGFAGLRAEWLESAYGWEESFEVEVKEGTQRGKFAGVDEEGCLLLKGEAGVHKVVSGHVRQISAS